MSADRPKILLADDSVTIRKVVELTFADEGIDVVSVADGDAAMKAFVADQPDLVIADVNMPGIGGYKICEIIKEDDESRHIPVILLTGSFEPFDPGEASRVGANFYFTKPFQSIRHLVEKVTDLLDTNAFDMAIAQETEDIDELYNSSFAETLKIPANDTIAETEWIRIEDDDDDEESVGAEIVTEEQHEVSDLILESELSGIDEEQENDEVVIHSIEDVSQTAAVESEKKFAENIESGEEDTELIKYRFERISDEEEAETTEMVADPFATPVDLGDASMDDEMIETTRHGELGDDLRFGDQIDFEPVLVANASEAVSDPFASPVTTDDTMAKYNWADETEGVVEQIPQVESDSTLLRIEFAENEDEVGSTESGGIEIEPSQPDETSKSRSDTISSELIEMIAQRVIDKLSDKVVREVALEAVPRITENMIREALDHETKK